MKLKDSFFTIAKENILGETLQFEVELNPEHIIYKAHFPEQKVTPGVCILQMAKELLEEYLKKNVEIVSIKNVKFLSVISPDETPHIIYVFERIIQEKDSNKVYAQISVKAEGQMFVKLSFTCQDQ